MTISPEEFDKKFDDNEEDVLDHVDMSRVQRPGRDVRRVNVDLPTWMIESLDAEANRVGVTRQSVIKMWIAERLDSAGS